MSVARARLGDEPDTPAYNARGSADHPRPRAVIRRYAPVPRAGRGTAGGTAVPPAGPAQPCAVPGGGRRPVRDPRADQRWVNAAGRFSENARMPSF